MFCLVVRLHCVRDLWLGEVQGIEVVYVDAGEPETHCGLPRIQATPAENQALFNEVAAGTEVEVTIPAPAAYDQPRGSTRFRFGGKSGATREHAKESR